MTKVSKLSGAARAVVLETLKEQKTLSQLSSEFGLHANQTLICNIRFFHFC
jgi:hypothetical protein